jgi:hypothetical protein
MGKWGTLGVYELVNNGFCVDRHNKYGVRQDGVDVDGTNADNMVRDTFRHLSMRESVCAMDLEWAESA